MLFLLFLFLAFFLGRSLNFTVLFPDLFAMSLFFLSTSIGPLITPWEKTTKTYEGLILLQRIIQDRINLLEKNIE